ncbi:MAG: hypothetical protein JWP99_355 [Devosia sp.]|nr:hypothetical protein [Devosia sp.]
MVELFGRFMTRRQLASVSGSLSQFAGVRSMVLADGLERGIRMLEFRSGTGLRFTVLVDRAFDIAECTFNEIPIGWHSPTGFRHPGLHDYEGEGGLGWQRSFSGLLVTCGLDHILFNDEAPADHYFSPSRKTIRNFIHGRVSTIPGKLDGYGERWEGDRCILWCEGTVTQAAVFAEHLELQRRIEIEMGTNDIRITDRVTNRGFRRTPHMYCYHINVGYPLLDDGSRYLAPIADVVWASHAGERYRAQGVGYNRLALPGPEFIEQVWQHELAADEAGTTSVALVNDRLALGFAVTTRKEQFPCMYQWQNLQSGQYALGIEPSTNHVLGAAAARQRGEMIMLEGGEYRAYDTVFSILPGAAAIAGAQASIRARARQPDDPYPPLSGNFLPLRQKL